MSLPAVILAGGAARRMGGTDKTLLRLGSGTVLDAVIARIAPQATALALSANGPAARFAPFGLVVLPDDTPDLGPLSGILSAMRWAASQGAAQVVTVAGDTPFLPRHIVPALRLGAESAHAPIALAESGPPGEKPRLHPTCGLWSTRLAEDLARALSGGTRKLGLWALEAGATRVGFDVPAGEPDPFFNINTPDDLARAQGLA